MKLKIGSRDSKLALAQVEIVKQRLMSLYQDLEIQVVPIKTEGDKRIEESLALIGGKGLFLKELEEALFDGRIDIAIHSLKDVPAQLHEELPIICYLEREDPRDAFLSYKYNSIADMPLGAVIGTSSARRSAYIKQMRPDINIVPLRGNVDTRLLKMRNDICDGCVLAYAGLKRLNIANTVKEVVPYANMVPAIGQGVICIQAYRKNPIYDVLSSKLKSLNCDDAQIAVNAERFFMKELMGNCTSPIAAFCEILEDRSIIFHYMYDKGVMYKGVIQKASLEFAIEAAQEAVEYIKSQ